MRKELKKSVYIDTLVLVLGVVLVSIPGLITPQIEGLDGAHHIMDGVFFYDALRQFPVYDPVSFTFDYYKQYPALGFMFWPPLYPFFESLFFFAFGLNLFAAQLSILACSLLLAGSIYAISRTFVPRGLALITALCLTFSPSLFQYFNVVMLEIPTLLMMCLCSWCYLQIRAHSLWSNAGYMQLLSLLAALSLYTKQTAFICLLAIAIDILLYHPKALRSRQTWLALLSFLVLATPLVLFTLKFGQANIQQSIGQNTQAIMASYQGIPRWTVNNWLYYPYKIYSALPLPISILGVLALTSCALSASFRRENFLWLTWIAVFYLFFSFFDNKSIRFVLLIFPPIYLLAFNALWFIAKSSVRPIKPSALAGFASLPLLYSIYSLLVPSVQLSTVQNTTDIIELASVDKIDGNLLYLGHYRQVFVFDVRRLDTDMNVFVLQGEDLLATEHDPIEVLRKYRVRRIIVENNNVADNLKPALKKLLSDVDIEPIGTQKFYAHNKPQQAVVLAYHGTINESMAEVILSSDLIQ